MTTPYLSKQHKGRRMKELFAIAAQRYLDAGGEPRKSVNCNEWLTEEELQEFSDLSRHVVTDEDIANYLKKHGTWRDRMAVMKERMN